MPGYCWSKPDAKPGVDKRGSVLSGCKLFVGTRVVPGFKVVVGTRGRVVPGFGVVVGTRGRVLPASSS